MAETSYLHPLHCDKCLHITVSLCGEKGGGRQKNSDFKVLLLLAITAIVTLLAGGQRFGTMQDKKKNPKQTALIFCF